MMTVLLVLTVPLSIRNNLKVDGGASRLALGQWGVRDLFLNVNLLSSVCHLNLIFSLFNIGPLCLLKEVRLHPSRE